MAPQLTQRCRAPELRAAPPTGTPERIRAKDDEATTPGLQRTNESADTLAGLGYSVEQRPTVHESDGLKSGKKLDLRLGGEIFDVYAPSTGNVRNVVGVMRDKVLDRQAYRLVVNLTDSPLTKADLTTALKHNPVAGLRELIVIDGKDSSVTRVFPDRKRSRNRNKRRTIGLRRN